MWIVLFCVYVVMLCMMVCVVCVCYVGLNRFVWLFGLVRKFSLISIEGMLGDFSIENVVFWIGWWCMVMFVWFSFDMVNFVKVLVWGWVFMWVRFISILVIWLLVFCRLIFDNRLFWLCCIVSLCDVWLLVCGF